MATTQLSIPFRPWLWILFAHNLDEISLDSDNLNWCCAPRDDRLAVLRMSDSGSYVRVVSRNVTHRSSNELMRNLRPTRNTWNLLLDVRRHTDNHRKQRSPGQCIAMLPGAATRVATEGAQIYLRRICRSFRTSTALRHFQRSPHALSRRHNLRQPCLTFNQSQHISVYCCVPVCCCLSLSLHASLLLFTYLCLRCLYSRRHDITTTRPRTSWNRSTSLSVAPQTS